MKTINKNSYTKIFWKVFRGNNKVSEDFHSLNTELKIFVVGSGNKYYIAPIINRVIEPGYDVIEIEIPSGMLEEGAYDLRAIWWKNKGRNLLTSNRCGIFGITDSAEEAPIEDLVEIKIASYTENFGRDGMSAYETAVMYDLHLGIASEKEWVMQETVRIQNEEARKAAEEERKSNEVSRISEETKRATAETSRKYAEEARVSQENTRKAAEEARNNAENARKTSETTRVEQEYARIDSENNRAKSENTRVSNENNRVEAERSRVANEVAREAAEVNREARFTQNEQNRSNRFNAAETARNTKEQERIQNEGKRVVAESSRASSETIRVSNETQRIANENARKAAEEERQATYQSKLDKDDIVQTTGSSADKVMSQKAVTDAIKKGGGGGGSSVTIVNNLTEGGEDKALSAEMGKILSERIEEVAENGGGLTEIPDNSITTTKMADKAVTMAKLSDEVQEALEGVSALINVTNDYSSAYGQYYGTVGDKVQLYSSQDVINYKLAQDDGVSQVKIKSPGGNISSLIQYVDDNDIIISIDLERPGGSNIYEKTIVYPEGATHVYVSGVEVTLYRKTKAVNIPDGSVTTDKIADGAVNIDKLSADLQGMLGGGGDGSSIASQIAYDNINSDVYPTNVQGAIDTLASRNLTGKYRVIKNSEFVLHEGYIAALYVDQFATITSGDTLRYSDPVFVNKGDTVIVRSQGTQIGCICLTDAEASFYKAKAISNDGSQVKEYTYTAERDCYIAISSRAAALFGEVIRDTDSLVERNMSPVREEVIQSIYTHKDISFRYEKKVGQTYGDVGNVIEVNPATIYQHILVNKNDGITEYKLRCPLGAQNPSSLVQYVNNLDIIISRSAEGLTQGEYYTEKVTWPEGATKVYISGTDIEVFTGREIELGVIGDASKLQTHAQIIVDAINEITDIYPTTEIVNAADEMELAIGQAYGNDGESMQFSTNDKWRHIKLYKDDMHDIRHVDLAGFAGTSSLIQYVDTNNIVVERDIIDPEAGVVYRRYFDFPEGAEAVYVSSDATKMVLAQRKKTNIASKNSGTARFRVLSWNIGHYAKGNNGSSTITEDTYESQKREFRKVFNKYGADIVGLCEYSSIFYGEETATDAILPQYQYKSIAPTESGFVGLALYSAIKMTKYAEYSVGNGYTAYESHIDVAGKDVIVCICHLPWQSHDLNKAAISTILSRYDEHPYVVVMGDLNFNTGYEEDDAKMFTDAGYQVANWGYLGKILTSYNNKIASNYLDNVCVKGGSILHTEVLQNTPEGKDPDAPVLEDETLWDAVNLSDHFPIICDVMF